MLFNSFGFFIFLGVTITIFWSIAAQHRWMLLLLMSCIFYASFKPVFLLVIFSTIVFNYASGLTIERNLARGRQKYYAAGAVIVNLLVLLSFKYFNFINDCLNGLFLLLGSDFVLPYLNVLLPVGLSFYTLRSIGYLIEISRGNQKAEKHFGIFALSVLFFPTLVAGPIENPHDLIAQFRKKTSFDYYDVVLGLKLVGWGLFKKVVVADQLGLMVDTVYADPYKYEGFPLIASTFLFGMQIYFDFSGYSDIAFGAAKAMGISITENFNRPFSSKKISEFWKRWHISLFKWFNNYLFNPIVIRLRAWKESGIACGLMITFLLSGLWHGAGLNYIVYGGMHGLAIVFEMYTKKGRSAVSKAIPFRVYNSISVVLTFCFVIFSFIFYRSADLETAFYIVKNMFSHFTSDIADIFTNEAQRKSLLYLMNDSIFLKHNHWTFWISIVFAAIIFWTESRYDKLQLVTLLDHKKGWIRAVLYYIFILIILVLGSGNNSTFIYFQF